MSNPGLFCFGQYVPEIEHPFPKFSKAILRDINRILVDLESQFINKYRDFLNRFGNRFALLSASFTTVPNQRDGNG